MIERHEFDTETAVNGTEPQTRVIMMLPRHEFPWREWLDALRQSARAKIAAWLLAGAGIGLAAGLAAGWLLWPVEWTNISYTNLEPQRQTAVIETLADLYAYNQESNAIMRIAGEWPEAAGLACDLASHETDRIRQIQYIGLAYRLNGEGCK